MNGRVVLERATLEKLFEPREDLEVCDEAGNVLGRFSPKLDHELYEGVVIPFTEEQLRQAEQEEEESYTTAG